MNALYLVCVITLLFNVCSGQYSGDELVFTPSAKTVTDSSDDSGSGPDDEDVATGSGMTTRTTTTATDEVTTAATTSAIFAITTDDEDLSTVSGSGSGEGPTTAFVTRKTTTDADIYIIDSTPKATTKAPSTSAPSTNAPSTNAPTTTELPQTPKATTKRTTTASKLPSTTVAATAETHTSFVQVKRVQLSTDSDPKTVTTKSWTEATEGTQEPKTTQQKIYKVTSTVSSNTENDVQAKKYSDDEKDGFPLTTEVIIGVAGCALLALILIAFLMYRLKKRDEGSYLLDDSLSKPSPYKKGLSDKEAFV